MPLILVVGLPKKGKLCYAHNVMKTREKTYAPRNRTLHLSDEDWCCYRPKLRQVPQYVQLSDIIDSTICQDVFTTLDFLPSQWADLVFADPPYNLTKDFNGTKFSQIAIEEYEAWLDSWISKLPRLLKPTASVYICGDWNEVVPIIRTE